MRICFICTEMFGVKKFGGLGRATRMIGRELSKLGPEVFAVIPRPRDIAESAFEMDGITVISYPAFDHGAATRLLRDIGADIYHSQNASMLTYLARRPRTSSPSATRSISTTVGSN
jgi:glycogen synthase